MTQNTKEITEALKPYIPSGSVEQVMKWMNEYNIELTVAGNRKSKLGDYTPPVNDHGHRISVNGNLNPYSFLTVFVHELAHLITFQKYGRRVKPHGKEWKGNYGLLMQKMIDKNIFPEDLLEAIKHSIKYPAASSCTDVDLLKALRKYNTRDFQFSFVEELDQGQLFLVDGYRVFKRGKKLRKRYQCTEVKTGKVFIFSPIAEVIPIER